MNIDLIKRIIVSQREDMEEMFNREKIIERDINTDILKSFLNYPNVLAILGVRRCGKSVFSWLLLKDTKFGYVNFFDERFAGLTVHEFDKVLQAFYELYTPKIDFLIFDEIQQVNGWEKFISRLRVSKKIVVTGSSSQLLSGELATFLTGRHIDFVLYPFSFKEFLLFNDIILPKDWIYSTRWISRVKKMLNTYIRLGGFPEVHKFGRRMLVTIYSDILEKDVIRRHRIKKENTLKEIAKYLVSNFSFEFTYTKLKNVFGLKDVHTVKNYVGYLKEAYLILVLDKFSPKLKLQYISPKKVYSIDNGIAVNIGFALSDNIGRLMENLVAVELFRRRSYMFKEWEIYYWKNSQGYEVDFVIKSKSNIEQLIQVTYASSLDEIEKREIKALVKASRELKCYNLTIVTWDLEDKIKLKENRTIRVIPLWKWLLSFNYH